MVTTRAAAHDVSTLAVANMTDDQMQELLGQASERLKAKQVALTNSSSDKARLTFPKLDAGQIARPYTVSGHAGVAKMDDKSTDKQKSSASVGIRKVEDPVAVRNRSAETKKATLGTMWFNLPKTNLTPELKRDLQLIKMRNVLDPHRHYKKDGGKLKAPEYSQVGTIIEGPTEYFSARLQNKERKQTLTEQVLETEKASRRFKNKYAAIQDRKTSGKKNFYKALKAKRTGSVKKR